MVSVFNFIRTVISTKVCGARTLDMVRARTGEMKAANLEGSILGIGFRIRNTAEVRSFIKMEIDMMGTGLMVCHKEKAE